MIVRITATWNPSKSPETKISLGAFEDLDDVSKLDFLQDVLGDLRDLYDKESNRIWRSQRWPPGLRHREENMKAKNQ